jgi:hypothetical protein
MEMKNVDSFVFMPFTLAKLRKTWYNNGTRNHNYSLITFPEEIFLFLCVFPVPAESAARFQAIDNQTLCDGECGFALYLMGLLPLPRASPFISQKPEL